MNLPISRQSFELLSSSNNVLIMLDGLDEVFDVELRKIVVQDISNFANTCSCKMRVVVISRVIGYANNNLETAEFRHYKMLPLEIAQIKEFLTKWHKRHIRQRRLLLLKSEIPVRNKP